MLLSIFSTNLLTVYHECHFYAAKCKKKKPRQNVTQDVKILTQSVVELLRTFEHKT